MVTSSGVIDLGRFALIAIKSAKGKGSAKGKAKGGAKKRKNTKAAAAKEAAP